MIRIFDQRGYIENYIKKGLTNPRTWRYDAILYVRWLKLPIESGGSGEQFSKMQCRKMLFNKLNKLPYWRTNKNEHIAEKCLNNAWKNKEPLSNITSITVPVAVINWFKMQNLRKNEQKLLFTMYVGYLIKKQIFNTDSCNWFNQSTDRLFLRGNANISSSTSIKKTLNVYRDKKFIDHRGECFALTIMDLEDFKKCEENTGETYTFRDLYNIGNELFTFYESSKYCIKCGKVIDKSSKKKYCEKCYEEKQYQKKYKTLVCEKCGKEFILSGRGKRTLCDDCYVPYKAIIEKTIKCEKCGKKFTLSGRGKRTLCDDCYSPYKAIIEKTIVCEKCGKKFIAPAKSNNKKLCDDCYSPYKKIGEKTIVCEKCGKEFTMSGNGKRALCDDCYKEYEKELKRIRNQKYYKKNKN